MIQCRKCGAKPNNSNVWLERVNEKGVPGIWECRPDCGSRLPLEDRVIAAIEGKRAQPKLLDRIADALIERAKRTPYVHLPGYMNRYWLKPPGAKRRFAARIHHILRSDLDHEFHDHPWNYWTLILRGRYTEVTPVFDTSGFYVGEHRATYYAGQLLRRKATDWHRLELEPGEEVWTLFMTGRPRQRWGFLVHTAHKQYWRTFLAEHNRFLAPQSTEGNHVP